MSNSRRARRQVARAGKAAVRLRESTAVLDRPTPTSTMEAVSNRPWSEFSQADYTPQQWRRACLIDTGQGAEDAKDRYALPVREPSGAVNRNGVHAAAGRLNQVDAPAEAKRKAAKALVGLYRGQLDEEPPPRLLSMAGQGTSESDTGRQAAEFRETVPVAIREAPTGSPLVVDLQLIQAGWNKAGTRFYPADVLARDIPKVYPAGTHMYLDHPTATEEAELPERSVTRLAAVLIAAPYSPDGGRTMRGRARVFAPHREFIGEAWRDIGVSINGDGEGHYGERDGRSGLVVEALTEGRSIDFVTKAGAGGRILQLLESATRIREARNVGGWLEARIHQAFTVIADEMYGDGRLTREERIVLSGAIGEALNAFVSRLDADASQLYARDLFDEPASGDPQEETVRESGPTPTPGPAPPLPPAPVAAPGPPDPAPTSTAPPPTQTTAPEAAPANQDADGIPPAAPTSEGGESLMPEGTHNTGTAPAPAGTEGGLSPVARAEIAEAQLREAQARISDLTTQNATVTMERDTARSELARMRITEAARSAVATALAATDLPQAAQTRVTESVTASVPTTSDGQVDANALTARIGEAIERERSYIASIREAAGEGRPNGLGGQPGGVADVEPWRSNLFESFKGLGMNEQAARAAANGR